MVLILFYHRILQRDYRKMTISWSFSYNSFIKLLFNNTVDFKPDHSYGPQTYSYKGAALYNTRGSHELLFF